MLIKPNNTTLTFKTYAQHCCQRINCYLLTCLERLPFTDSALVTAMRYGVLSGGKRIRPLLVYLVGTLLGVPEAQLDPAAAAVECIHAFSLLHDDLPAMDNSLMRRGQPAAHVQFGQAEAILAGNALQALAFSLLSQSPLPALTAQLQLKMVHELAQASGVFGLCSGQSYDLKAEQEPASLAQLDVIQHHKTGALIRCALRLGALTAGETGQKIIPLLDRFADAVGLAFQLQDDLLDVLGDPKATGKPSGSDQRQGKNTYPALLGIDATRAKIQALHREALAALSALPYDTHLLIALTHFIIQRNH